MYETKGVVYVRFMPNEPTYVREVAEFVPLVLMEHGSDMGGVVSVEESAIVRETEGKVLDKG
jgi:hypothetical protein